MTDYASFDGISGPVTTPGFVGAFTCNMLCPDINPEHRLTTAAGIQPSKAATQTPPVVRGELTVTSFPLIAAVTSKATEAERVPDQPSDSSVAALLDWAPRYRQQCRADGYREARYGPSEILDRNFGSFAGKLTTVPDAAGQQRVADKPADSSVSAFFEWAPRFTRQSVEDAYRRAKQAAGDDLDSFFARSCRPTKIIDPASKEPAP